MILKLTRVLGINENKYMGSDGKLDLTKIDPDPSYVLTVDNVMKMLAIDMKFRWVLLSVSITALIQLIPLGVEYLS